MVSERVEDYVPAAVPPEVWESIGDQARAWVSAVPTDLGRQAVQRLKPLAQYLSWRIEGGLTIENPSDVFRADDINWFVAEGCGQLAPGTRATYRSALRTIGEWVAGTDVACPDRSTPIERAKPYAPYSRHEQAAIFAAISGQATGFRRHNAMALAVPSRGAGLGASDIAALVGSDIQVTKYGVVINVPGPRPRLAPVLATWEQELIRLAELCGDRPLFRSQRSEINHRDIARFCERLKWSDAPAFSVTRMRVTWIVEHLTVGTPLRAIAEAAGVTAESLARYAQFAEGVRTADLVRLLRRAEDPA